MSVYGVNEIISWILARPLTYIGPHNESQPRTHASVRPIEPSEQLKLVWNGIIAHVTETLYNAKSIRIPGFGAFSFEVMANGPKSAQEASNNTAAALLTDERKLERFGNYMRPCFLIDDQLRSHVTRQLHKQQISQSSALGSVYQQGFRMVVLNATPIAAGCYLQKDVVESARRAFFKAVVDLVRLGHDVDLNFKVVRVTIRDRKLKVVFDDTFVRHLQSVDCFKKQLRRADVTQRLATTWKTSPTDKFNSTQMATLIKRPVTAEVVTGNAKTRALRLMSIDFTSTSKVHFNRGLPAL